MPATAAFSQGHIHDRGKLIPVAGREGAGIKVNAVDESRIHHGHRTSAQPLIGIMIGIGYFQVIHDEQVFTGVSSPDNDFIRLVGTRNHRRERLHHPENIVSPHRIGAYFLDIHRPGAHHGILGPLEETRRNRYTFTQ
ncbi:hypothetical protein ES703_104461 [subsurface metagenome]